MIQLAIDWSVVGIKAGQLILSLSILVVLHELGHFLPAKWFKCRVEKFYLFFDPYFSLFKKKIGETEYGIGWLPLGGYVKISGMIDESMDKEQLKKPAEAWEFRSKPAWQRLIIMIGGVTVNLLLGFILFAMILFVWGEEVLPSKNLKYGIYVDSLGQKVGLKDGDMILEVGGKELPNFFKLSNEVILNEAKSITILRNGQKINLPIPEGTIRQLISRKGDPLAYPKYPAFVDSVSPEINIVEGTFRKNDQIIGFNGASIDSYAELLDKKRQFKDTVVSLQILRNGTDTLITKVKLKESSIGFMPKKASNFLKFDTITYTFFESIPAGVKKGWSTLVANVQNFKMLFTSKEVKASESLGSFLSIGNMFDANWDWERFWSMTALLSIVLAFMNILPIPALDGGHVIFTLYEMISGRKPSDKFMEYAQMVGMVLLLGLMAYALGLDFWRLFK
ncbi:MAG: RIP metalloprotease RseP [Chitinophagaceae bacterium]|uniref:RIP metalloprotease RseP n=1 Tax=unclassified Paraflavitalea TaxID=2798305 RepID=UPI003D3298A9|nr:RIP metalloprotease RseP [Chitinophagaceae bacterium]